LSGSIDAEWTEYFSLLDSSYATSNFRIRFHLETDGSVTFPGYYVDDIGVGSAACLRLPGGLVVGNVFDANSGLGLSGAAVSNGLGDTATAFDTPLDPAVEDGFYILFSPDGAQTLTAVKDGGYGAVSQDVAVVENSVIVQDFDLPAGLLSVDPASLETTLDMGESAVASFTLTNEGGLDASFEITERGTGMIPAQPGAPVQHRSGYFPPHRITGADKPQTDGERPIPIEAPPWVDIADYPFPVMDNTAAALDGLVYSVGGFDGFAVLNSGFVYDPSADSWEPIASMNSLREKPAAAFVNGLLYVTGGWGEFGDPVSELEIYDPATDTWSTGSPVPAPYAAAAAVSLEG
jgi:Kelch motif